ncbi:iron complex transport system permease protein [Pseudobutyrivibrio sp. ACV-2]|uniref:FecCD family ABC transporter permease n=1 Tax=Pseudobutyrivibrio sp. ACV-2 TaxID=1520801 RepID=UPI00089B6789|nr:iron ABC transporter permease [Pseudobutyrivibrio sp. ACV-2]SDZ89450.1 iron complex transport system permease protein [Pseudobutyrivibrio sp. ACV-2]
MSNKKIYLTIITGTVILIIASMLSITYGAKSVGFADVIDAVLGRNIENYNVNVVQARIPRTVFGILAGAALSVSGVLMQTITRNPIADPSILGVNTGASLFIVIGISVFNIQSKLSYISLAFLGAMLTAILVYKLASMGYGGATPIKLALSGAAISTALSSLVSVFVMPDSSVMTSFRFWQIGSVGGASNEDILLILPVVIISLIVSVFISSDLNTLLLSEETATALGLNVNRTRLIAAVCGVLLCSSITALAGPISFIGLMIPHLIRLLVGSEQKKLILISALYGGSILVISDVLGRLLGRPGELESGIMTALIGAPCFIAIIRRAKVANI